MNLIGMDDDYNNGRRVTRGMSRSRNQAALTQFEQRMDEQEKPVLSANEARQATRGHGVRYVLAISVTLAVLAMLIAYFVA
ncbi:MAG TPA: hypothetical protein VGF92_04315 [Stellaceae bacterium]|jgi:hypothetical protein